MSSWPGNLSWSRNLDALLGLAVAVVLGACAPENPLDALIARNVEARGGMERLAAVESLRASGRAIAGPGREARVTREVLVPNRIRTEFTFQGVTAVYACDGSTCWAVAPLSGSFEAEPMAEADASLALEHADILGALVDWQAKGHTVELLGTELLDGREAFKVQVTLKGGGLQIDYLDAETALIVRRETTRTIAGRRIDIATTFADFREVDGVVFPHSIRTASMEEPVFPDMPGVLELVVEEAELNVAIDESRFAMPE